MIVLESDELEQITKFDETDRKPNADEGTNYFDGAVMKIAQYNDMMSYLMVLIQRR